jgi:excisionase family DNA binding protein
VTVAHLPVPDPGVEADDRRAALDAAVQRALGPYAGRATLNVPELADVLNVSRSSAYELVRTGTVKAIRAGRRVLVPMPVVASLLLGVDTNGTAPDSTAANGAAPVRRE